MRYGRAIRASTDGFSSRSHRRGIYCRPVCTVKPPRFENCRFYPSAAAAEVAGYRPCLRCRPELAPGNASVDATTGVWPSPRRACIEDRTLDADGLGGVASSLGISDRHLRRAFGTEFGVSPVEFAQTQRLLLAKRLLTDTPFTSHRNSIRQWIWESATLQCALQTALSPATWTSYGGPLER